MSTVGDDDFDLPSIDGQERSELSLARERRNDRQRAEIMSLLMAGLSQDAIGTRLGISRREVEYVLTRHLRSQPAQGVAEMRTVENARLNRAQAAIWTRVLEGDLQALDRFMRISERRSRLNGLDAPFQVELSGHVRIEMEQALAELQEIVLGEVISDGRADSDGSEADR